ncbi:dephospho-CoA kinase [Olivibacter sitiensis]|uniref:dephospho-CoA kinase n=1 Tax=Olivibacter sitiensis TaxID=376470 RepID=UPI0004110765|nr:dephospho-CoA kinase [Olivibacter sitiensis]
MLEIGVTGGIGSGKTTICRVFEVLGVPVFYADTEAKKVMVRDRKLVAALKQHFGSDIYLHDGQLDRKKLADIVFNDAEKLRLLNNLVHPETISAYQEWVKVQQAPYVMKEAALLFESGSYKLSNFNVLVVSPEALRIGRVMARDGVTENEVRARMSKQWRDEEKMKLADFVIYNDESHAILPQVLQLHRHFLQASKEAKG